MWPVYRFDLKSIDNPIKTTVSAGEPMLQESELRLTHLSTLLNDDLILAIYRHKLWATSVSVQSVNLTLIWPLSCNISRIYRSYWNHLEQVGLHFLKHVCIRSRCKYRVQSWAKRQVGNVLWNQGRVDKSMIQWIDSLNLNFWNEIIFDCISKLSNMQKSEC